MEMNSALAAFGALSQPLRLKTLRLLVQAGPDGMTAGDIAASLDVRPNTLSANLAVRTGAGLLRNVREGRQIRYFAEMGGLRDLMSFLLEDCCGGRPELCAPLLDQITEKED